MWELKEFLRERKKRRGRMEFWRILTFTVPYEAVKEKDSHPGMKRKGGGAWRERGGAWWERGGAGEEGKWQEKGVGVSSRV